MEQGNQMSYLIKGLQMKSKTLRKANAQALMNLLGNSTSNKDACEQIANMANIVDDNLCIVYCNQLIRISVNNDNLQYLTNEMTFWLRIKRILTISEKTENDLELFAFMCDQHDLPADFNEAIFVLINTLCKSQNVALLKRNQSMLMKCKLVPFCESKIAKYPEQILNTIEICTLECVENQLAFSNSNALILSIKIAMQNENFSGALKSLINVSSGNENAVESLYSEIDFPLIFEKLRFAKDAQLSLILGFLLNILEFRIIPSLAEKIKDIIDIYQQVNNENTHEMTNVFLIELLLLYCCKYKLITILKLKETVRIENTLQGINTLVKMGNRRWERIQTLATEIKKML